MGDHTIKALLICECQQGKLLGSTYKLLVFADRLAPTRSCCGLARKRKRRISPARSTLLMPLNTVNTIPTCTSAWCWIQRRLNIPTILSFPTPLSDGILRHAWRQGKKAAQISEIVGVVDGKFEVPSCSAKMRRPLAPRTGQVVLIFQAGAFSYQGEARGTPHLECVDPSGSPRGLNLSATKRAEKKAVNLAKAEVIVSAGRGIGKKDNMK